MNRQKDLPGRKNGAIKGSYTTTSSSNYSTCSDNPVENNIFNKENVYTSTQSTILSGSEFPNQHNQVLETTSRESAIFHLTNDVNNESNYTINPLDQNIDVLTEDDLFVDCRDNSKSDSNDESTKYLSLGLMSQLSKIKSNDYSNLNKLKDNIQIITSGSNDSLQQSKIQDEQLVTIIEETEIHVTNLSDKLPISNKTGDLIVEVVDQLKTYDKVQDCNKNSTKRVLFTNKDNIIEKDDEEYRVDKYKLKKQKKNSTLSDSRNKCKTWKRRDINENCNNHNSTESFILWEKFCETSNRLSSRRSFSFSELNSVTEGYGGDDEYSMSFKSLDDTYLSKSSLDTLNDNEISDNNLRTKPLNRSKSCDSLLREVKHLPHILYDRFLKCLAKEIENIRKQNVVCTCKRLRKDNEKTKKKHAIVDSKTKVSNEKSDRKETKLSLKVSPLKTKLNLTRLSPETMLRNSSQNVQRLSPKSPNRTVTTPKKTGLYSWHKEIVSPVGEYIRGKRQSPFKNSPSKKK